MIKSLISPLAWFLVVVLVRALVGLWRSRPRTADAFLLVLTVATWLLATGYVSGQLEDRISIPSVADSVSSRPTRVVVLAGGAFSGSDARVYLAEATIERVVRAAEAFRNARAESLIVTGRAAARDTTSEAKAMRALAVNLGVPLEKIALEPDAKNTFEHPSRIMAGKFAASTDRLIVVTDPVHSRRAITEFRRLYPFAVPASTRPAIIVSIRDPAAWIPQASSLDNSTRVLREWIGIAWYALRHRTGR